MDQIMSALKWAVQIFIPAFASLYYGLGHIYDWPGIENVVGTCAVITTFLGTLLGVSTYHLYKEQKKHVAGDIYMPMNDVDRIRMSMDLTPEELKKRKTVVFNVHQEDPE